MTNMHLTSHRWALGLSAAALTTAMLATGGLAASAAPLPAASSASTECAPRAHLVTIWTNLPAQLKSDLKDLKASTPGTERVAEAKQIRADALGGAYGAKVQKFAQNAKGYPLLRLARRAQACAE